MDRKQADQLEKDSPCVMLDGRMGRLVEFAGDELGFRVEDEAKPRRLPISTIEDKGGGALVQLGTVVLAELADGAQPLERPRTLAKNPPLTLDDPRVGTTCFRCKRTFIEGAITAELPLLVGDHQVFAPDVAKEGELELATIHATCAPAGVVVAP